MRAMLRLLFCVGAIVLAGSILELAHPGWVAELATDLPRLPSIRAYLYEELEFGTQLDGQMTILTARAEAKQRILKDLMNQRLTLVEAALRFREVDQALLGNDPLEQLRHAWPGRSVMERYCRQIIHVVGWELCEQPDKAAAVPRAQVERHGGDHLSVPLQTIGHLITGPRANLWSK